VGDGGGHGRPLLAAATSISSTPYRSSSICRLGGSAGRPTRRTS
jgi:hypothetical protein